MLVVSNGNGGAGAGSLSVVRINPNGTLRVLGAPQVVPGSGDLTHVIVIEKSAQVFVYVTDPNPSNKIFAFRLTTAGALVQLGPPLPTGTDPRGMTESNNLLFAINSVSTDISEYRILGNGALAVVGPNIPVPESVSPRVIRAEKGFLYIVDCNPPPSDADNRRFFVFRIRSAVNIKQDFESPFQTADTSVCGLSICGRLVVVVGLHPDTNLQTAKLRHGLPTGNGQLLRIARGPYEIAKIEPDCRYFICARSGTEADVRAFRIKDSARFLFVQGGVAAMNTGTAFVNGLVVVDGSDL
jgi:hypothetical protein